MGDENKVDFEVTDMFPMFFTFKNNTKDELCCRGFIQNICTTLGCKLKHPNNFDEVVNIL